MVYLGNFQFRQSVKIVQIDIMPGDDPNEINTKSKGLIPVAIVSTVDIDFTDLDGSSLTFGRSGDEASLKSCATAGEDVNGDGLLDLVCHFRTRRIGFQIGDTAGNLKGELVDGTPVIGVDSVLIVH